MGSRVTESSLQLKRAALALGLAVAAAGLLVPMACGLSTEGALSSDADAAPGIDGPDGSVAADAPSTGDASEGGGGDSAPHDGATTDSASVDSAKTDSSLLDSAPADAGVDQDSGCTGVQCRGACLTGAKDCTTCADPYLCGTQCLPDCTSCNGGVNFVACAVCYDGGGLDAATFYCGPNDPSAFCLDGNYPHCSCQSNTDCAGYQHCSGNTTCKSCGESSTGGHCGNGLCCVQATASCSGPAGSC